MTTGGEIDIRPPTSVYATYQRLSYKAWYAIAEFVDNSTQSYFDHRDALRAAFEADGTKKLRVEISYDPDENILTVYDNAFGMEVDELRRALTLNSPPPNRSGRSEFGMGLKTAACWFGMHWTIETTQLGSPRMLVATMDIAALADNPVDTVPFDVVPTSEYSHFTKLTIRQVNQAIRGRTVGRVLDQLGSIYRQDLRSGEIDILWDGQPVAFEEAPILEEVLADGTKRVWKKPIYFAMLFDDGRPPLAVIGWIALRDPGKQRDAGLVLLRRDRVIIGGPEAGYRPMEVFGAPNLYRSQRLIGELHLDEWPVTQAKDGFDWSGDLEDEFIERLRVECKEFGDYAESYRSGNIGRRVSPTQMQEAAVETQKLLASGDFGKGVVEETGVPELSDDVEPAQETEVPLPLAAPLPEVQKLREISNGPIVFCLTIAGVVWTIRLHWQDQLIDVHWMQIGYPQDDVIEIYLNTAHPFFIPYLGQAGMVELLQKLVIALALAEKMARMTSTTGLVDPAAFRNYMNKVLRRIASLAGGSNGR